MFRRKLKALEYHHPDNFDVTDEQEFRNLVVWLEDQKIRLYKIEDRTGLRNTTSSDWPSNFKKYLNVLDCPVDRNPRPTVVDWLLSHAVRLEYSENHESYNSAIAAKVSSQSSDDTAANGEVHVDEGLLNLTVDNPDLKAGIMSLAKLLNLPEHEDHFVLLQAIRSVIESKLSPTAPKELGQKKKGDVLPLDNTQLGFDTGDSAVNEASKIMRLLHVSELRDLQTKINEAIVAVQAITANPKTDQSLGRVGK